MENITLKLLVFGSRRAMHNVTTRTITTQGSFAANKNTERNDLGNADDDVLFQEFGDKGLIILNRPKALNSLNHSMARKLIPVLKQWEATKNVVVIKGSGEKAFCAGGDVKAVTLHLAKPEGEENARSFFRDEYTLDHLIGTYRKPYVALINGIVMGGGAGLSVHGKFRVATEKTLFAMPEASIGLFPDVGASYYLPRLNGKLGLFLGLTGQRLKGMDVKLSGIATHYVSSAKLPKLTEALLAPGDINVGKILDGFDEKDPAAEFSLAKYSKQIDKCFSGDNVEDIFSRLKEDNSEWAQEVIQTLEKASPTALKVTKKALDKGKNSSLAECLMTDFNLVYNMILRKSDFAEGVRALLIDKDQKPMWNPKTLDQVTDEYVKSKFIPPPADKQLKL